MRIATCIGILVLSPTLLLAQTRFRLAGPAHLPQEANTTRAMVQGDLDGDGDPDLVTANAVQGLRLLLNRGGGVFVDRTAGSVPPLQGAPHLLALGDVDRDGDLDLVCNLDSSTLHLLLGDGQGGFSSAPAAALPRTGGVTTALALGDVDGDGDLDLLCANQGPGSNLFLGDGQGAFVDATAASMGPVQGLFTALALGDVDGDGDLDLLCADGFASNRLFLGDGKGRFTPAPVGALPADRDRTLALVLADLDGDRDLDLVCANLFSPNRLFLNDGKGSFRDGTANRLPKARSRVVLAADLDGDRDLDLVWDGGGTNRLLLNDGKGVFTDQTATRLPGHRETSQCLLAGDVDVDGDLDLLTGNDLVTSDLGAPNHLYFNDGSGHFRLAVGPVLPRGVEPGRRMVLRDLNGDGYPDLLCHDPAAVTNLLYLNDGLGGFMPTTGRIPKGYAHTTDLVVGDLDGDNDRDLIVGHQGLNNALYLNDGKGRFTDMTATHLPLDSDHTQRTLLADVDGDGDLDLVTVNHLTTMPPGPSCRLFLNGGKGRFSTPPSARFPLLNGSTTGAVLEDLDGDGDPDLVLAGFPNLILLNDGKGRFADVTATHLPAEPRAAVTLVLGDVDGDGDPDLCLGDNRPFNPSPRTWLLLNDGKGRFTDRSATHLPGVYPSTGLLLADLDEDGDPDLLAGCVYTKKTVYLENDGRGRFTDVTANRLPVAFHYFTGIGQGDVDGDGDRDLVLSNPEQGWRLVHNLHRQVVVPHLLAPGRPFHLELHATDTTGQPGQVILPLLSAGLSPTPLTPFGTLWLTPAGLYFLPVTGIDPKRGQAELVLLIPGSPALLGGSLHIQGFHVPGPTRPMHSWHLTNAASAGIHKL